MLIALGHVDLDVADVVAVPDRLHQPVGEAQYEDVVHRLLAEEVVDAEDLRLVEDRVERLVELLGRGEVGAERLLGDDPPAVGATGRQLRRAEQFDDRWGGDRWDGEMEQPPRVPADGLLRGSDRVHQRLRVVRVGGTEREQLLEGVPCLALGLDQPELGDRVLGVLAELLVGRRTVRRRGADDAVLLRQQPGVGEVEQAGQQLALGEIARRPEDHDDVVVGDGNAVLCGHRVPPCTVQTGDMTMRRVASCERTSASADTCCERASASEGAVVRGLRGRGTP